MNNLLNKWLKGTVTWQEEKQLLKMAEKDDFLKEAMAGYNLFPEKDHLTKIKVLKRKIRNSKKERKPVIFYLPRVAATAVILLGVFGVFPWLESELHQSTALSDQIEMDTPFSSDRSPIAIAEQEEPIAPEKTSKILPSQNSISVVSDKQLDSPKKANRQSTQNTHNHLLSKPGKEIPLPYQKNHTPNIQNSFIEKAEPSEPAPNAQALDEPVITNNNKKENKTEGTRESIEISETTQLSKSIKRRPSNYATTSRTFRSAGNIGLSNDIDSAQIDSEIGSRPQPQGGLPAFEKYVRQNLRYPTKAKKAGQEAKVQLSFYIDSAGRPTDFQSGVRDTFGFREEAIRLLENGPAWEQVNQKMNYLFYFTLEEK